MFISIFVFAITNVIGFPGLQFDLSQCESPWMIPAEFQKVVRVELSELQQSAPVVDAQLRLRCTFDSAQIDIDGGIGEAAITGSRKIEWDIDSDAMPMRLTALALSDLLRELLVKGKATNKSSSAAIDPAPEPVPSAGPVKPPAGVTIPQKKSIEASSVDPECDGVSRSPSCPRQRVILERTELNWFFQHRTPAASIGGFYQFRWFRFGLSSLFSMKFAEEGNVLLVAPAAVLGWQPLARRGLWGRRWGLVVEFQAGAVVATGFSDKYDTFTKANMFWGARLNPWMQIFAVRRLVVRCNLAVGWTRGMNVFAGTSELMGINGFFGGAGISVGSRRFASNRKKE